MLYNGSEFNVGWFWLLSRKAGNNSHADTLSLRDNTRRYKRIATQFFESLLSKLFDSDKTDALVENMSTNIRPCQSRYGRSEKQTVSYICHT